MFFLLIISAFILIISCSRKDYNGVLFDKDYSSSINGLFVIIVFLSHSRGYLFEISTSAHIAVRLLGLISQKMVITFFFFSGYGLFSSYLRNKSIFTKNMKRRFINVLTSFMIAVTVYLLYSKFNGITYSFQYILLSFIGWNSVGNSNWFIFITLLIYLLIILFFDCFKNKNLFILTLTFILFGLGWKILVLKAPYWVDTLIAFPFGMFIKLNEKKIFRSLQTTKTIYKYFSSFFVILLLVYIFLPYNWIFHNVETLLSLVLITILATRIQFKSVFLKYISKYTFEIYIYQRLVFDILRSFSFSRYTMPFLIFAFIGTVTFSIFMRKVSDLVKI